ncbi:hypothetical protein Pelo_11450 [Pelomyxa schiedti]|nr:hypothetical protein Pelo_11450 [Pelomyxa schiedti]
MFCTMHSSSSLALSGPGPVAPSFGTLWEGAKRTPSSSNATTTLPPDIQSPLSAQATSNNNGSEEPRCSVLDICSVTTQDPAKCVEEIASMTTAPHNSQHNSLESSQIATLADSPCVLPSHRRIFSTVIRMRTVTDADGL